MAAKGFVACVKTHFGVMPGKKLGDLAAEIKRLNPQDRWDLASAFNAGHAEDSLTSDALEKEREKAKAGGVIKAAPGYGELEV